jgi:hypothetical protein
MLSKHLRSDSMDTRKESPRGLKVAQEPLQVVLKVRDAADHLTRHFPALLDFLADQAGPFQVCIVDCGSQDGTDDVGREWARQYPQVEFWQESSRPERGCGQIRGEPIEASIRGAAESAARVAAFFQYALGIAASIQTTAHAQPMRRRTIGVRLDQATTPRQPSQEPATANRALSPHRRRHSNRVANASG